MTRRLLHLLSQRPGRSGSGVFLQALVREAGRRGYSQHALVAGPQGTTAAELPPLTAEDLTLAAFPNERAPFFLPGNSDVMPYPSTVFAEMTELQIEQYLDVFRAAMRRSYERFRPDIVHTHHLWLMTALAAEVFSDVPVVATSHHAELRQAAKAPHLMRHVLPGIRRLEHIGVLTPHSVLDTVEVFGADPARVSITGAGYDADLFHYSGREPGDMRRELEQRYGVCLPPPPVVTFIGRLSTAKGVPLLIRACAAARKMRAPGLHLVLVGATGSGTDGARAQETVRQHGDVVLHVGAQPQEAIALILQCSDLFVLPSLFEGLGLTTLEAAASGCPVLISDLPTIRSFVPDEWVRRGAFILHPPPETTDVDVPVPSAEPDYVASLGETIATTVARPRDEAVRADLAAQLEGYTWGHVFDRYEPIYRDATIGSDQATSLFNAS